MPDNLPAKTDDKPPPQITKKIRAAIDALVHGDAKSITAAAKGAGLTRSHLSRELGRPHIATYLHEKVVRNDLRHHIHSNESNCGMVPAVSAPILRRRRPRR